MRARARASGVATALLVAAGFTAGPLAASNSTACWALLALSSSNACTKSSRAGPAGALPIC